MAKPYASEMARLHETFEWAASANIDQLRKAVRTAGFSPLLAVGSGGSLTAAHALATIHRRTTRQITAVATPLDVAVEPLSGEVSAWLLSAGGSNVDILAAARALIAREPRQITVVCGRRDSPLGTLCAQHPFVDLLVYPPPAGKDGFLATNSLLGFTLLLARAYAVEFDGEAEWVRIAQTVEPYLNGISTETASWQAATSALWERPTTIVLHGPDTSVGAVDLESKFTEAAIGNLQVANFRNFAHGRHHWLAKRGDASAILALLSDDDLVLGERTLALIPSDIPRAQIYIPGNPLSTMLISLIAALQLTGWAGPARGIDPGRPGVPEFGRKLYHQNLPLPQYVAASKGLSEYEAVAIVRKAGLSPERLRALGEIDRWKTALDKFRNRLRSITFVGLVLDYDGTIVDTRHRFEPAREEVSAEIARLLDAGVHLAIATGRGVSVRRDLRACLPKTLWSRVLIGYYNGAEIAGLEDDATPDGSDAVCEGLAMLALALRAQPELAYAAEQTDRRFQITLQPKRMMPENRLWDLAHQVILLTNQTDVAVTRSSHSVDIVASHVSKLNVLASLRKRVGEGPILTIGDRGRWPGNDYELLREPFALSVDEISVDPDTCWNLAPKGQRGVAVTTGYLAALNASGGRAKFDRNAFE